MSLYSFLEKVEIFLFTYVKKDFNMFVNLKP